MELGAPGGNQRSQMRSTACEKGFPGHVGKVGDTLGRVKAEGGCWLWELNRME